MQNLMLSYTCDLFTIAITTVLEPHLQAHSQLFIVTYILACNIESRTENRPADEAWGGGWEIILREPMTFEISCQALSS